MKKLKQRWGIESNFQLIIILVVFSATGSTAVYVAKPFLNWIGLHPGGFPDAWWGSWIYWTLRILVIFPIYQVLLVIMGAVFGQFAFFWNLEKKMLRRMGLGFFLPSDSPETSRDKVG
ncbi:MAG: diacylglyceryl transferase [Bacteroidetes bacterium]|nr:MAG: diacylglyceryl transferase [Bacteroidota bacterium]